MLNITGQLVNYPSYPQYFSDYGSELTTKNRERRRIFIASPFFPLTCICFSSCPHLSHTMVTYTVPEVLSSKPNSSKMMMIMMIMEKPPPPPKPKHPRATNRPPFLQEIWSTSKVLSLIIYGAVTHSVTHMAATTLTQELPVAIIEKTFLYDNFLALNLSLPSYI